MVINERPFKKMEGSRPRSSKTSSARLLGPLPAEPYEFARWRIGLKVNIDYHVDVDRHYYSVPYQLASLMLAQGVPIQVVADVLGHASIRMTADVYGHILAPDRQAAAEAMSSALWSEDTLS